MWMVVAWLLTLEALSLAVWPVVRRALPGSVDRGWAASRVLGPLLLSLVVGVAALLHLAPYTRLVLALVAVLGAGLAWLVWRPPTPWRWPSRAALLGEAIFLGTFALALGLRFLTPSVETNERPMDFALLNSFVRADALPVQDPWFAGQPVAYYTFGYLSWASPARLADVPVEVAYNLAVASVFAATLSLAWATATDARRRYADGFLAAATLGLVGNLRTLVDVLASLGLGSPDWWASWAVTRAMAWPGPGWAYWLQASRVIPNGITEFPFFSLVVGDLHPHYMAMPVNVLVVTLALAGLRRAALKWLLPLSMATLAALAAGNTWNAPAAAVVLALGLVARDVHPRPRPARALAMLASFGVGAGLLTAPFLLSAVAQSLSLGWTPAEERLWPGTFVVLFLPYVLAVATVLLAAPRWRGWPLVLGGWAAIIVGGELLAQAGVALTLAGAGLGLALLAIRALAAGDATRAGLLATCAIGVGLVCVPELAFLRDQAGSRMNTVFKFHFQALLFLGVALPPLVRGTAVTCRIGAALRRGAVYAALLTLLYVPLAPFTRLAVSPSGGTLDALAFLTQDAPDDLAAVRWLRDSAPGGAVVVEAVDEQHFNGRDRADFARVATFSGMPTLAGWPEHEREWRGGAPAIGLRLDEVEQVYAGPSLDEATRVLETHGVSYVIVGRTEHTRFGPAVDERFRDRLEPVFQSGQTTIYRVPDTLARDAGAA